MDYHTGNRTQKEARLILKFKKKPYQTLVEGNRKTPCDEKHWILDHSQTGVGKHEKGLPTAKENRNPKLQILLAP